MQTVSFYSYKGGTGRTLVVANVARHLARFGQRVVALDFDLEAPGLHYKFNLDRPDEPIPVEAGAVDYLHAAFVQHNCPASLAGYFVSVPARRDSDAEILLIPAGRAPSPEYWDKLSQINWHELLYAPGAPGVRLFLEWQEQIREELEPDFLLIDSRSGITELGGVATKVLPDKLVCLLLANRENLEGARAVLRSVLRGPRVPDREPPEVVPVLSRIPSGDEPEEEHRLAEQMRSFLNEEAERLEDTLRIDELLVLHSEPDLQVTESLRVGGDRSVEESVLLRDYLRLFTRIIPVDVLRHMYAR